LQPGLVSPVFVGRGAELASMVAALEAAMAADPAGVIVGGEAGVGKLVWSRRRRRGLATPTRGF
jgi:hypothetical protein